jgi:hypothetical protein
MSLRSRAVRSIELPVDAPFATQQCRKENRAVRRGWFRSEISSHDPAFGRIGLVQRHGGTAASLTQCMLKCLWRPFGALPFRIQVHCGLPDDIYFYIDSFQYSIIKRSINVEHGITRVNDMARENYIDDLAVSQDYFVNANHRKAVPGNFWGQKYSQKWLSPTLSNSSPSS